MGSDHQRLEARSDRRLEREARRIERTSIMKLTTKPNRGRLAPGDVEIVGTVGEFTYGRYDGIEYIIEPLDAADSSRPLADGEIRTVEARQRTDYGTVSQYNVWQRGFPVAPGTYEAAVAAEARRRPRGPKPHRPVDIVGRLPALRGTADFVMPVRERQNSDLALEAEMATMPGRPVAGFVPGTPAASDDPAAILARLERRGVNVSVTAGGRLLITSAGGRIPDDMLDVVIRCERLLVAALSGVPALCELPHAGKAPAATTIVAVGILACRDHAAGRLPATVEKAGAA
jgi:hypothetical protein